MDPPKNQNIGQTAVIEMGPNYTNQFFYSLETNSVLSSNPRDAYDLMFENDGDRFYIWLNTSTFMSLVRTGKTDFASVLKSDTTNKKWYYEFGMFNDDSNAIGEWWTAPAAQPLSKGEVYIINRGYDTQDNELGLVKFRVNDYTANGYSITWQQFGKDSITSFIPKDNSRLYRYFSFKDTGSVVNNIEPDKTLWDFCFTRFTVGFYNLQQTPFLPYLVTGVLSNPQKVQAYLDSSYANNLNAFDSISISDFNVSRLQTRRDCIGFEWKSYSTQDANGDYTIRDGFVYFIKVDEDKFYKLRFIAFLKDNVRGYPTFEFYGL